MPDLDERGRQKRGPVTHAYSIASAPFQTARDGHLEFLVVLEVQDALGRFTESLFDAEAREGSPLGYVERTAGDFTLARRAAGVPHVLMVATGTGLAPFASMVRELDHDAFEGRPVPWAVTLLFANRTAPELAFHEELAEIAAARRFDFVYVPTVSRPGADARTRSWARAGRGTSCGTFSACPCARRKRSPTRARQASTPPRPRSRSSARPGPACPARPTPARCARASTRPARSCSPAATRTPWTTCAASAERASLRCEREEW